jgi:stage III sporulation protein AH
VIIKRKTILLVSLVILLIIVGYINHQFTKQSLLHSSNEYQEYEEAKLEEVNANNESATDNSELAVSEESKNDADSDIAELANQTDSSIEEAISQEAVSTSSNYFVEYRLARDKLRAALIERLNQIINNEKTEEKVRTKAQQEIINLNKIAEKELLIEGLIKAKGFEDALVFLNEDNARVVIDRDELTEQDVMKILEIVTSETGLKPTNIKIMKKIG